MLETIFIASAISQLALLLLVLLLSGLKFKAERFTVILLLCISAEMINRLLDDSASLFLRYVLTTIYTGTAGVFWLTCYSIFEDKFDLKRWQIALVLATIALPLSAQIFGIEQGQGELPLLFEILVTLPQLLEFALLIHGVVIMLKYWQHDLVTERRRLRPPILLAGGIFLLFVILVRYIFKAYTPWMYELQYLLLALLFLSVNLQLLPWQPNILFRKLEGSETVDAAPPPVPNEDDKLINQLQSLMSQDKLYRTNGLTIGEVSKFMNYPEYRLRELINTALGFRNFNDFLAHYRIEEAAQRIADINERQTPFTTIAMEAGYKSISSFNKSFKQIHNMTPTEYRQQHLK